jgi:signal transduction histidine kinase
MTNSVTPILREEAAECGDAGSWFEIHPAATLLCTSDAGIISANDAARVLLGPGTPRSGGHLSQYFPGASSSSVLTAGRRMMRRADGTDLAVVLRVAPLDASSRGLRLVTLEDVSEHDRQLAAADREFESLTSAAGHDLRGPLRILKGFAEALEDECGAVLNEEGRNFLAEILKASDRMEGLIDGLLTFSRAARAELKPERLDLSTLVELVCYELRHAHTTREVECQVESGLSAWGDVRLIMTVLRALIGNSWKFTARKPAPRVSCAREVRDGHEWIAVTDNGAGFDMTQAARLFKPFTRLHRHDEFPGHGMGLATAHRILQRHGGEISAESAPGIGTTVRFRLPPMPD